MENIKALDEAYVAHTYGRFPVTLVRGEGSLAYDEEGKEYVDMGCGIAVNSFGYSDSLWAEAVKEQLTRLQHTSNLYYTAPCARLAQLLCQRTGMKKVFFGNSGAEANECAIKVARKWAQENKGKEYATIITLKNSFHGRTLTTLAATGQEHYHELFQPLTPGFVHAEPGNLEDMERLLKENRAAAILVECIQGEGGVIPMDSDYLRGVEKLAETYHVLLMVDEVQTGNGRTGTYMAYMHAGIHPDVVSTAKGLGGGLPIGACLMGERVQDVLGAGDHGSTFGGNPVVCAGALSIVERLDEAFLRSVREKGDFIRQSLEGRPGVAGVFGRGLMVGVEPDPAFGKTAGEIVGECLRKGVMFLTAKNRVRLLPALNIPMETLRKALNVLLEVMGEKA